MESHLLTMGGLEPPTQWRGVCRAKRFIGAPMAGLNPAMDARLLDGRVKPGHGEE